MAWAQRAAPTEAAPARAGGTSEDFAVSRSPDRATAGRVLYDLYCPRTPEPKPLVLVAPDIGESRARAEPLARHLTASGLVVVVVEPAPDRASYPARLAAVLDEVLAAPPEVSEPRCARSAAIGAWGAGRGGVAVAELARTRAAAGKELAAVVTAFASRAREPIPDMATPLLAIEGTGDNDQIGPRARSLLVLGAEPCDLGPRSVSCRARSSDPSELPNPPGQSELVASEIYQRSRRFFQAYVSGDAAARAEVDRWDAVVDVALVAPTGQPSGWSSGHHDIRPLISLPLVLGGTNQGDGGFVYGLRPELVIARLRDDAGFGLGLYGELLRWSGDTTLGVGLSLVHYLGALAYAPSVGLAKRTVDGAREDVVSAGLFLGLRHRSALRVLDFPLGVRVDGRFGRDGSGERAVMVTVCLDLAILSVFALVGLGTP